MTVRIPILNVGQFGVLKDLPADKLPLNAWTEGRNVRPRDGGMERYDGDLEVFGATSIAPYHLIPVPTPSSYFWVYAGLAKVYVWDGGSHTNITRQSVGVDVDYSATADRNWTSCRLGGVLVLNNGVDPPQMWLPPSASTRLTALSNWPANTLCGALRSFGNFLVALDIDKNGTRYPHMVKWSHPADPGAVPVSWDNTDPTKDAGEVERKESKGFFIDAARLRDIFLLYKEDSIEAMQFIGGVNVFRFYTAFSTIGAISRRCMGEFFNGQHAVFGFDDMIIHNGQSATSLLDLRLRRAIYNNIDSTAISRSFIAFDYANKAVWFCYPETGSTFPNVALVWEQTTNNLSFRELQQCPHIESGLVAPAATSDQWNAAVGSWDSDPLTWGERLYTPAKARLLLADKDASRLRLEGGAQNFNGTAMTATLERRGLGFPLKTDQPPDYTTEKYWTRMWPHLSGTVGGTVKIYVGKQARLDAEPVYNAPVDYVIGSSLALEPYLSSAIYALKFESTADISWRLTGYDVEIRPAGRKVRNA